MLEFQEKKRLKNILYSRVTLIAVFIVLIFIARATINVYYKQKESGENLAKVKEEVTGLEKRQNTLTSEINRLNTGKGTEEEIRKKFMVGKEGEQVIVIVDDNKSNKTGTVGNNEQNSIWSKFMDFFR